MRKISNYIEWHAALILFAFATLAMNWERQHPCLALTIGVVGLLLFCASARSAFLYKSTALIDKYDERFFDKMRKERRGAARFLLGQRPEAPDGPTGQDDLEDVLDFFECPLMAGLEEGTVSKRQIYDMFYHWIRLYSQFPVTQNFLKEYHEGETAAYTGVQDLYASLETLEKKTIIKEKGTCSLADLKLSREDLAKYLEQEARLRTS